MRPKKIIKSTPKVLQEQSGKIQQKLEQLRQQVQKKKKQQLNRTSQPLNMNGFLKGKPNSTYTPQSQFSGFLNQIKFYGFQKLFKDKGICKVQQIISLTDHQIDQLKQLPVGYRIKLRKYIQDKNNQKITPQSTREAFKQQSGKQIQEIIKNRGGKKFVALEGFNQEEFDEEQLNQQQQQEMIKSLINAFNPRTGIIKNTPKKKQKKQKQQKPQKHVHWSLQVDEMEQSNHKNHQGGQHCKYPKQMSPKRLTSPLRPNNRQYCWNCLKIIDQTNKFFSGQKEYCSFNCMQQYQQIKDNIMASQKQGQITKKLTYQQQHNLSEDEIMFIDLSL